jgi:DNA-binding response OmpR family regulator
MLAPQILIVEDDRDTLEMLEVIFEDNGFESHSAGSVKAAEALIDARPFDLVLLDSWLPDGDGVDICRELRSRYSSLPIIFYSGAGYPQDIARALEAGCSAYLIKPCSLEELNRVVKQVVSVNRAQPPDRTVAH